MTSAASAYEMPEGDEHLDRLVADTSSGNVVYLMRAGEAIAVVLDARARIREIEAAVTVAEAELGRMVELRSMISELLPAMSDDMRQEVTAKLDQAEADTEDAVDVATARVVLARIEAGEETVIPWDQALAELTDG